MISIYLSGPIAGCNDEQCFGWRNYLKEKYKGQFKFIDPTRRDYRHLDSDAIIGDWENQKKIVTLDKIDIDRSDAIIVNTIPPFPSVGTSQEELYAYERGKLVVVVWEHLGEPGKFISPWLLFHSHAVVKTLDEAIEKVKERLADEE